MLKIQAVNGKGNVGSWVFYCEGWVRYSGEANILKVRKLNISELNQRNMCSS